MKYSIERKTVLAMGMPLEEWTYASCTAHVAEGDDWATIYEIKSEEEGKGHATVLLIGMKMVYKNEGKKFGGSVALNDRMKHLYQKLDIEEYSE